MHSSMMRTTRFSGHLSCMHVPRHACPLLCMPPATHALRTHVPPHNACPSATHASGPQMQTAPVKILPCSKLCLRAVKIDNNISN